MFTCEYVTYARILNESKSITNVASLVTEWLPYEDSLFDKIVEFITSRI
jgi:hypothetical protein